MESTGRREPVAAGIVIVGGGAGGLELACQLGRKLGSGRVTLVDRRLFHVWKPSLHEVAAGTLDIHQEGLSYLMLAHDNGFDFVYGAMQALDAAERTITVGEIRGEGGEIVVPRRELSYQALVIAVGSTANYFGIPGAAEHSIALNGPDDAERFRLRMLKILTLAELEQAGSPAEPQALGRERHGIDIVIIGGGATGVELAAELREASQVHANYGFRHLDPHRDVRITLVEGAPRILAPLSEKVSDAAARLLAQRHVRVVTGCKVARIDAQGLEDEEGNRYPADLCVWAAGIKAPDFLATLGLPTAKAGALEVDAHLRVKGHRDIYALGDCAFCIDGGGRPVPPRAQAAHQQAAYLKDVLVRTAQGRPAAESPYVYRDHGSLVSIGTRSSVGSLMGSLFRSTWFVEGIFARMMYASLHLLHHKAVLGTVRTGVLAIARFLVKRTTPLVKLH
ncbi:MAG: FAD-dependent oxidoreductase [Burkholderiaceae bacterium]|nr:FAD-dependent oxidoreductase [Burkholderiaceae bacterium]